MKALNKRKILMIVIRNTARLDYVLPILCKIRSDFPESSVSVLYCAMSKKRILKKSRFYFSLLDSYGIIQYDFADFMGFPYLKFRWLWRWLFARGEKDSEVRHYLGLFNIRLFSTVIYYYRKHLKMLEIYLQNKVRVKQILPFFEPDIVLFDNTSKTKFIGRDHFFEYFSRAKIKVVLVPHGAHIGFATNHFIPFNEKGDELPDYCEFWMPYMNDKSWHSLPEKKSQFHYVGYPGLDSEWLEMMKKNKELYNNSSKLKQDRKNLKCLFIIRPFRKASNHPMIIELDEFNYLLDKVREVIYKSDISIKLIIKPHPSNDNNLLWNVMRSSGISDWEISYESIYALLSDINCVISLYSTTLLVPAMAGIPVILLNVSSQGVINQDPDYRRIYSGLSFSLDSPEDLIDIFPKVSKIALDGYHLLNEHIIKDIKHLRNHWEDNAITNCIDRLKLHS